jgi:hypothetical protein
MPHARDPGRSLASTRTHVAGAGFCVKKRINFMIDSDLLQRLRLMKSRTRLTESEQIRQAIRMWLDSKEWPLRRPMKNPAGEH